LGSIEGKPYVRVVTLKEKFSCKILTFTLLAMHATVASQTPRNPCPPIKQIIKKVISTRKKLQKADPKNQKDQKTPYFKLPNPMHA
jgi:hypothetical protein